MEIAYKVVSIKPLHERRLSNGRFEKTVFTSVVADGRNHLTYKVGEVVRPFVGKLFVFKSLPKRWQINRICASRELYRVFRCVVDSLEKAEFTSFYCGEETIQDFWNWMKSSKAGDRRYLTDVPVADTHFCNECVLLEDVSSQVEEGFYNRL